MDSGSAIALNWLSEATMRTRCLTLTLLGCFACLSSSPNGSAATIGPRCGNCYGTASALTEAAYVYSPADYVHQVAVKIARNDLVSVPGGPNLMLQLEVSAYTWVFDIPKKGASSNPESIKANYNTAKINSAGDTKLWLPFRSTGNLWNFRPPSDPAER